ncbi:hypothetical protein EVAR_36832_1 [Eumeta japonica]|uniref:GIY-YIG domain-containing protein n=1 Tax=Eumeta variegata TaxID=151549 RepID=A0A4C1WAI5_EUMVA|nr:hypothetical protein EVAR_36832_1 [Eumeta japonica]
MPDVLKDKFCPLDFLTSCRKRELGTSIDKYIQFALELENNNRLSFLDILVEKSTTGELITSWYKKPYSSGRILNFNYNHPPSQKLGVAQGFLNRAIRVNHESKVNESVPLVKDNVKKADKSRLIYTIHCTSGKWYVGQTKQKLKARLRQHRLDCKPENMIKTSKTALADHFSEDGHAFQFDNAEIKGTEKNFMKKNFREMIFIRALNCLNFRTDAQSLSSIYSHLIDVVKRSLE